MENAVLQAIQEGIDDPQEVKAMMTEVRAEVRAEARLVENVTSLVKTQAAQSSIRDSDTIARMVADVVARAKG
jgi:hypothetical protein